MKPARLYGRMGRRRCNCLMVRAMALAGRGSGVLDNGWSRLEALSGRFSRQQPSKDEPLVPSETYGRQAAAASRGLADAGRGLSPPPIDTLPPDASPSPTATSHLQRRSSSVLQTHEADAGVERSGMPRGMREPLYGWHIAAARISRLLVLVRASCFLPAALEPRS